VYRFDLVQCAESGAVGARMGRGMLAWPGRPFWCDTNTALMSRAAPHWRILGLTRRAWKGGA